MTRGIPEKGGYLIPANIAPANSRCVIIYVPDDIRHIAAFWGALQELGRWQSWEKETSKSGVLAANVWDSVIENARESFESGDCGEMSECCPMRFNLELGTIQIFSGGEWVDIPDTDQLLHGATMSQTGGTFSLSFNQGGDTIDIDIDASEQNVTYNTPPLDGSKTDEERACAIAENLITWIMERYQDTIDAIEAGSDFGAAVDSVLVAVGVVYIIVDAITDVINEISEAGTSAARAMDTVGMRRELMDELYCRIVNNDYVFDKALWNRFEDEVIAGLGKPPIAAFAISALTDDGILDQAARASYGTSTGCASVNCSCYTFFTVERFGIGYGSNRYGTLPDPITPTFLFQARHGIALPDGWYQSQPAGTVEGSGVARCWSELGGLYAISEPVDIDRFKVMTRNSRSPSASGTFGNMTVFTAGFNTNWQRPYFAGYAFNDNTTETEKVFAFTATGVQQILLSMSQRVQIGTTPCDGRFVHWEAIITAIRARKTGTTNPFTWSPLNDRMCT